MNRRIVLVDFYWTRDKDPRVPLGHASLYATLVERTSVEVRRLAFAVNAMQQRPQEVAEAILDCAGDLAPRKVDIAIGAYVWAEALIQELLPLLRSRGFGGRIILGGPQITYAGAGLEDIYPAADLFIRGYGEDALCEVVRSSDMPQVPGVHVAGTTDLQTQARVELEALPSPWLTGIIPLEGQNFIRWETQRGCTFRCAFCQHREAGKRLKNRELDDGRIAREIDLFCASDVQEIAVLDPIFNSRDDATADLKRFVANGFDGRLSLQCRAEMIDGDFLDAAQQLDVCLEFGLQTIHTPEQRAIKRPNHMPKVDEVFRKVRERDIDFEVTLIFGLPEQTLDSFKASVDWCLKRQVPVLKAFPLMLLRGTALDRDRDRWDLVEDGHAMPKVVASNTFTRDDWEAMDAISTALKRTEGEHPVSVGALMPLARGQAGDGRRWQP